MKLTGSAVGPKPHDLLHLLTDLLGLDGGGVLSAEAQLSDGHVVQDDVEVFCPLEQLSADQQGHLEDENGCSRHKPDGAFIIQPHPFLPHFSRTLSDLKQQFTHS